MLTHTFSHMFTHIDTYSNALSEGEKRVVDEVCFLQPRSCVVCSASPLGPSKINKTQLWYCAMGHMCRQR